MTRQMPTVVSHAMRESGTASPILRARRMPPASACSRPRSRSPTCASCRPTCAPASSSTRAGELLAGPPSARRRRARAAGRRGRRRRARGRDRPTASSARSRGDRPRRWSPSAAASRSPASSAQDLRAALGAPRARRAAGRADRRAGGRSRSRADDAARSGPREALISAAQRAFRGVTAPTRRGPKSSQIAGFSRQTAF